MKKSENISELAKALAKVQGNLMPAKKDSQNPFFRSSYADLNSIWDSCRKLLTDNGLSVVQTNEPNIEGVIVETCLLHSSGEWISGSIFLPLAKHDAQGVGSAITYGRRYGLASMVGIISDDDDDGNAASKPSQQKQSSAKEKPIGERIEAAKKAVGNLGGDISPVGGESPKEYLERMTELYKELNNGGK